MVFDAVGKTSSAQSAGTHRRSASLRGHGTQEGQCGYHDVAWCDPIARALYNDGMVAPLLTTKLYIPPPRPNAVIRPRLIERLNEGLRTGCKLALISAPAGFGKTTLVSEWIAALTPSPSPDQARGSCVAVTGRKR